MTTYTPAQEEAVRRAVARLGALARSMESTIYSDGLDTAGRWLAGLEGSPAAPWDGQAIDALAVFVADRMRDLEISDQVTDQLNERTDQLDELDACGGEPMQAGDPPGSVRLGGALHVPVGMIDAAEIRGMRLEIKSGEPVGMTFSSFPVDMIPKVALQRLLLSALHVRRPRTDLSDPGIWELAFADACARADRQARAAAICEAYAVRAGILEEIAFAHADGSLADAIRRAER